MSTPRSASLPKVSSSSIHRFRDHLRGNHMNSSDTMSVPEGFLWGTAISAHQSEGNNVNSDAWICENVQPTRYREPSGDACDSYNRWREDLEIAAGPGLNLYRFGLVWSRTAPEPGPLSRARHTGHGPVGEKESE